MLALQGLAWWQLLLTMGAGYVVWTLTEYWLHRIVFHFEPEQGVGLRLHWIIHGVHHDHPNDPLRLVMPPSASIPLALLFVGLFQLLLPTDVAWALDRRVPRRVPRIRHDPLLRASPAAPECGRAAAA